MLLAVNGCKKAEDATKDGVKPAAEAKDAAKAEAPKADEAKAEAPKADEAKAEAPKAEAPKAADVNDIKKAVEGMSAKEAVDTISALYAKMNDVAKKSGSDCAQFGKEMLATVSGDNSKLTAAFAKLATIDESSQEGKAIAADLEALKKVTDAEDSDMQKTLEGCKENDDVKAYSMAMLGVMMNAMKAMEDEKADAAEEAPAADGAKAE